MPKDWKCCGSVTKSALVPEMEIILTIKKAKKETMSNTALLA